MYNADRWLRVARCYESLIRYSVEDILKGSKAKGHLLMAKED